MHSKDTEQVPIDLKSVVGEPTKNIKTRQKFGVFPEVKVWWFQFLQCEPLLQFLTWCPGLPPHFMKETKKHRLKWSNVHCYLLLYRSGLWRAGGFCLMGPSVEVLGLESRSLAQSVNCPTKKTGFCRLQIASKLRLFVCIENILQNIFLSNASCLLDSLHRNDESSIIDAFLTLERNKS